MRTSSTGFLLTGVVAAFVLCSLCPPRLSAQGLSFGDGTYIVGVDIPSGVYQTANDEGDCYWERDKGFSGDLNDIIDNGFVGSGPVTVSINPTDRGFTSDGCGIWTAVPNSIRSPQSYNGSIKSSGAAVIVTSAQPPAPASPLLSSPQTPGSQNTSATFGDPGATFNGQQLSGFGTGSSSSDNLGGFDISGAGPASVQTPWPQWAQQEFSSDCTSQPFCGCVLKQLMAVLTWQQVADFGADSGADSAVVQTAQAAVANC